MVETGTSHDLARQDIVYLSPADHPHEGLPIGNGSLGAMVWTPPDGLEFIINHTDIFDDAPDGHFDGWAADQEETWTAHRGGGVLTISPDLPIHNRLYLSDFEARLELGNAQAASRAVTPFSEVSCKAWVSREAQVGVIQYQDKMNEPVARRINLSRWGSRTLGHWYSQINRDASIGLSGTSSGEDGQVFWIRQKLRDMEFVLAVRVDGARGQITRDHSRSVTFRLDAAAEADLTIYFTVVTSEDAADPLAAARDRLADAAKTGPEPLHRQHLRRWNDFWSKSYIRLSEPYLENLWYIHLYMMASSSGGRHPAEFIDGLWSLNHDFRAWTHIYQWNQQELYWCLGAAGHSEVQRPYLEWRHRTLPQAIDYARSRGVPNGAFYTDVGNRRGWQDNRDCVALNRVPGLLIALEAWRYFQYTGDIEFLRDRAWPLMLETATFQLAFLRRGDDGKLHTDISTPYEDDSGYFRTRDCITDLSLMRAAFDALRQAAAILERNDQIHIFEDALNDLVDFTLVDLPAIYFRETADGLVFNREWPELPDYPIRPPLGPVGLGDADKVESTKGFSIGLLEPEGGRTYTWKDATRPLEGKFLMRGCQEAPVFPAGLIGLKDRGTERFAAAVATAKGNWTPCHGHALMPIVFARLGLREHLRKYLLEMPGLYQHFPQGLFTYACRNAQYDALHGGEPYHAADIRDQKRDKRHALRRDQFVHFGFEAAGTFCAALTEMLLQSADGVIRIFPALPNGWIASFRLRSINGFWVDAEADSTGVSSLRIESERGMPCRVDAAMLCRREDYQAIEIRDTHDQAIAFTLDGDELIFPTESGQQYRVVAPAMQPPDIWKSIRPTQTKRCGAATLGKERDF